MIKVIAFTGGEKVPSARYRVRQYIPALKSHGVSLKEYYPTAGSYPPAQRWRRPAWAVKSLLQRMPGICASYRADVVLLQREMISTLPTLEWLTRKPRVLDVDDAIYLYRNGWTAKTVAKISDLVICGNGHLAERFKAWNSNIAIVPTAVDTDRYFPLQPASFREGVNVGWIGTSGNFRFLHSVEDALYAFLKSHPASTFTVISDRKPVFTRLDGPQVRFVQWSADNEVGCIQALDIGIMPLHNDEWARGKCSFKMLQYMACGIPTVVSPVGMNADILGEADVGLGAETNAQWADALSYLAVDRNARKGLGAAGRALVSSKYSASVVAPLLANCLSR